MAMKAQTKRWVFAVGVAGSLLAALLYLDRRAPAVQFTQVARSGHDLVARSTPAAAAARGKVSEPPQLTKLLSAEVASQRSRPIN